MAERSDPIPRARLGMPPHGPRLTMAPPCAILGGMGRPQVAWQRKQREAGLCPHCGKPTVPGKASCRARLEQERKRAREARMAKRWTR